MKAEIVSIGTELLLGEIMDTNAAYLAGELPTIGVDLYFIHQVGDNIERLVETFRRALERSDAVLTTGGLGPTEDDATREAVARYFGEEMRVAPQLESELRAFFSRRGGMAMPENNLKQASLIPSATALPNPVGTAPGWWAEKNGKLIISMPGPPREMMKMWPEQVKPRLRERAGGGMLVRRLLKITGISEGQVDLTIGELLRGTNPTVGVYAKSDGIHVRLGAKAWSEAEGLAIIAPAEKVLRERFSANLWGTGEETLQGVVGKLLTERRLTLATMESCTGGLLASAITDAPGSSGYFKGGFVTYATEMKARYGVLPQVLEQHGAVSAETAAAMALAAREQMGASVGVGITGVAGPAEQEGKPVGTVYIGVDAGREHFVQHTQFPGGRSDFKQRVVTLALFQIRKALLETKQ